MSRVTFSDNFIVRGITYYNLELDIAGDAQLNIDDYTWYGHNRTSLHKNAKCVSGGVGFLIKRDLYNMCVSNKECEGKLW